MSQSTHSRSGEYRRLWSKGTSPSMEELVKLCDSMPAPQLAGLLLLDQSMRWKWNERITAEQYFDLFPELPTHAESAIDLIYSEFLIRERLGLSPVITEYIERFPQYEEELRNQNAFHQAMGNGTPQVDAENILSLDASFDSATTVVPEVPGYQILGELGRGGIGVVYKARHTQLNRYVALKMLLAGHFASSSLLRRFLIEAETTARLQHPNIVQIYEVGQYEGRPFLALEYVNGGTLSQWADGQPQAPREAASIIQSLAKAVHFAHEQGVVHRDLKPGNVLIQKWSLPSSSDTKVGSSGRLEILEGSNPGNNSMKSSFQPSFQLKIADFGLAKLIAGGSNVDQIAATMSGDVLGTAAYMSPEQARGDTSKLTAVTDVYSLGAILYELLTGRPPFVGVQPMEVLSQVIHEEPVRPSHLVRRLPNDLQTICLKCLEKNPGRRYSSATALADDLGLFLENQPIIARNTSSIERGWRWCRRNPVKTSIASFIAAVLILVSVLSSLYTVELGRQLTLTSQAKSKEQESKVIALNQLWESKLAQADAIRMSNQIGQRYDALKAIDAAKALGSSIRFTPAQIDQMRNATIACLAKPDMRVGIKGAGHIVPSFGIEAVSELQNHYAYRREREMRICQTTTGQEVARVSVASSRSTALLSKDGKRLAVCNGRCRIYDLESNEAVLIYETAGRGVWAFTPDGSKILGTGGDGQLCFIDLSQPSEVKKFGAFIAINEIVISPDSRRAAMYNGDAIRVLDLETGLTSLQIDNTLIAGQKHFAWHPNSKYLAIGPIAGQGIELWDVDERVKLKVFSHISGELQICFSSTGERLLSHDVWSERTLVWNVYSNEIEFSKTGINPLKVTADESGGFRLLHLEKDRRLITSTIDSSRIYSTLPQFNPKGIAASLFDLSYSPNGQLLAVVDYGQLRIFDSKTQVELDRVVSGSCYLRFVGNRSLLISNQLGLARWDIHPVQASDRGFQMGPPAYLSDSVAYAPIEVSRDGVHIALSTLERAEIRDLGAPENVHVLGPPADIRRLSFSPDGRRVATGEWASGKVCIWEVTSGELLHTFTEPPYCLVKYSPDGRFLATNSTRLRVWNAETWELASELPIEGTSTSGVHVDFSPDGQMIAVSDSTAKINFFDPADGRKIFALTDPNHHLVCSLAFNPDGSQLAAFSASSAVHIWDLVAMNEELRSSNLDLGDNRTFSKQQDNEESRISNLQIELDQRHVEIEAAQQAELLLSAVEKFEIASARAAIARMIKLQPKQAFTCNSVAWVLATGPQPLRDSTTAVEFARIAIADESVSQDRSASYLNTLGIALYRDNRLNEATEILEKSLAVQNEDDKPYDLYFLSMCSARAGDDAKATSYFEAAESLAEQVRPRMIMDWKREIAQFAEEAKLLLRNRR